MDIVYASVYIVHCLIRGEYFFISELLDKSRLFSFFFTSLDLEHL